MKTNGILGRASLGAMVVAVSVCFTCASAQPVSTASTSGADSEGQPASSQSQDESRLARLLKEASFSPGVSDIVRLAQLGTDTPILIAHVQASDHTQNLRPEDIAHLNENDVPDSVIASMIVRRAELRAQAPPAPVPTPTIRAPLPTASATVNILAAPTRRVTAPASTVTVIGHSDLRRGLSYRNHFYSARNFYSGTYGRVYAAYGGYSFHGPSYRRGHGIRVCR